MYKLIALFVLPLWMAGCTLLPQTVAPVAASTSYIYDVLEEPPVDGVLLIENHRGGPILDRERHIREITTNNTRLKIIGSCQSTCTMYLALSDRACIEPGVEFLFHSPHLDGQPLSAWQFELATQLMAGYYPELIKMQWMRDWRYEGRSGNPEERVVLLGKYLTNSGLMTACK